MEYIVKYNRYENAFIIFDLLNNKINQDNDVYIDIDKRKLFTNDKFSLNKFNTNTNTNFNTNIIDSPTRINKNIPAVLILKNNQTYGRENNNPKSRLLYKCIPDDITLPFFLVPYEIKHVGFSKVISNIYVTIYFKEWNHKYPIGIISQNIGSVDILNNFYEYQLYCKNMHLSISHFTKETNKILKVEKVKEEFEKLKVEKFELEKLKVEKLEEDKLKDKLVLNICKNYNIIDRLNNIKIFSIDPLNSQDFDDAFSVVQQPSNWLVSVYISNVALYLDYLNLWEHFSERVSTIYLPNKKLPMLPNLLSDNICSLKENHLRIAFTLDILLDLNYNIVSLNYSNTLIKVYKNYVYEEDKLYKNKDYLLLFNITQNMLQHLQIKQNYIKDSHDVVSYLMIFMNHTCAKDMIKYNNGIFRHTTSINVNEKETNINENEKNEKETSINENEKETSINTSTSISISEYFKMFNYTAKYVNKENNIINKHEMLNLDAYIHITSPIRRLVDLLNIIQFQKNHAMFESRNATHFYYKHVNNIDNINIFMNKAKKMQNECGLLHIFLNNELQLTQGYIFNKSVINKDKDKEKEKDKEKMFNYTVYLPEFKLISKIKTMIEYDNYEKKMFKLCLFNNEAKFKKKIRLAIENE
jgi:hypothetical protein